LVPPVALDKAIDEYATAPTGITTLDARLGGGFPRGQVSEIVGARSSARTSLLLQLVAAATARPEIVALLDGLDMADAPAAGAAGQARGSRAEDTRAVVHGTRDRNESRSRSLVQTGGRGAAALDVCLRPVAFCPGSRASIVRLWLTMAIERTPRQARGALSLS